MSQFEDSQAGGTSTSLWKSQSFCSVLAIECSSEVHVHKEEQLALLSLLIRCYSHLKTPSQKCSE